MTSPTPLIPPEGFGSFRADYSPKPDPELMEEVRGMSSGMIEGLRNKARHDRFFLAKGVLGYQDVNPYTHGPMCRFIEDRTKKRRMGLAPRGHLKSTLWTITDSIGLALEDPEECRILIVNEIEDNATGFLSEIKAQFENNELLRELFPELVPERFVGPGSRWAAARACLKRSTAYKEWTWSAIGVGGAITSRHFTHIKCDDLIGFSARESPAVMKYAVTYAKSLEPLLVDMDVNLIDFIGTRWAMYDLYHEMLQAYQEDLAYFSREDIEYVPELDPEVLAEAGFQKLYPEIDVREVIGTLQPIFPRKFSLGRLHRLSVIDPVLYYAQYKNNPIADGVKDFDAGKLRWFDFDSMGQVVYRDTEGKLQRWDRDQLDIVMACDPNSGELTAPDFPAIIVGAISPRGQVFIFDAWSRRVQPDAFVDQIFAMWQRWQPRVLGIEKAGQQQTSFYFKKKAKDLGVYIYTEELKPRNRQKAERIRKALQPLVNQGNMFVRKSQTTLRHQVQFHPDLENDDELDCAAYLTELFRTPLSRREVEDEEEAAQRVLQRRSKLTGYGA